MSTNAVPEPVAVRDAATVIVAKDSSEGPLVYLVRRSPRAGWLPELHVFPGGAVDAADRSDAPRLVVGSAGDIDAAYVLAAARETFEEVGLLFADVPVEPPALEEARAALRDGMTFSAMLAALGVRIDAGRMRYFSQWITPPIEPRRFDARFFVARAPADQIAEADAAEVYDGMWMRPVDALAARERGEINLIFPTVKHLERIAPYPTVDALLAFAAGKTIVPVSPRGNTLAELFLDGSLENAW
jgi:8-oxo-dGTP pyrophosphatase MutT (NUDIX family)